MSGEDLETIRKEILEQNDRGAAITAFAFLDETLCRAIKGKFIPLSNSKTKAILSGAGPLGTFEARVAIAYALDPLTDNMSSEMKLIARIRNKFAHRMQPILFSDREVMELCDEMPSGKFEDDDESWTRDPRNKYVSACMLLISVLALMETERIERETTELERSIAEQSEPK
jgi:DNA-binding MltR family transcriptional regulator